jgi:hypothetical protein
VLLCSQPALKPPFLESFCRTPTESSFGTESVSRVKKG